MMSPDQLIALSKKGRHIRVAKDMSDNRQIVIADRRRRTERSIEIPREHYENLMEETVAKLAERNGSDLKVSIGGDFYGRLWIEVRSGFLAQRTSRLGFSPRHINKLRDALADRQQEGQAAGTWGSI